MVGRLEVLIVELGRNLPVSSQKAQVSKTAYVGFGGSFYRLQNKNDDMNEMWSN